MKVPPVFVAAPPKLCGPDPRRVSRARDAYRGKAGREYLRRRFLRRVEP